MKRTRKLILICFIIFLFLLIIYLPIIRPWQLRWGATDEEVNRPMPGDQVVQKPTFNATRAVTVHARPEHIWPWIVQIGYGRAGWYSYDWIDNLDRPSAGEIIQELQHIEIGDLIPISPDGKQGFWVKDFIPNRYMLWGDKDGDTTWCWGLYPVDKNRTRLITRVRILYRWLSPWIPFLLLLDVGDIVMMRKCLLGIKERAEKSQNLHGMDIKKNPASDMRQSKSEHIPQSTEVIP
jgi:hypothetical protein